MSLLALSELSASERRRLGLTDASRPRRQQPSLAPDFLTPPASPAEPCPWWQRRMPGHEACLDTEAVDAGGQAGANCSALTRKPMPVG